MLQFIKESSSNPKCIFLAGATGSGKSTIAKQLIPSSFTIVNIDEDYEALLKQSGLGLNQSKYSPEDLSKASTLMQQSKKTTQNKLIELIKNKKNITIDGTGASSKIMEKKKGEMEKLGYETFLLGLYVSPITSLERNTQRERQLMPSIILRSWRDYSKNIDFYRELFGNNFTLINNEPKDSNQIFNSKEIIKKYFTVNLGKPKTPEEQAKSDSEKEQLYKDIEELLNMEREFDTIEEAKQKINKFING